MLNRLRLFCYRVGMKTEVWKQYADAEILARVSARLIEPQEKGGEYFFALKGNRPSIQDKARKLLNCAFPPSASGAGPDRGERTRTVGNP